MKQLFSFLMIIFTALLWGETLFEVKDASNNKVLDISTDGLRVLNGTDTLMVISTDGIRAYIQKDAKGLSRTFSVTTASSKDGEAKSQNKVFEVATDQGSTFYNPSNSSDKIFSISKGSITANVNQSLGREFSVNDDVISKAGSNLMKVSSKSTADAINDSTMLWYKEKNAFRVGHVYITAGGANVGQGSFASGYRCTASGKYSSSIGYYSQATNTNAFASGSQSTASGQNSCAIGSGAKALGANSFAAGYNSEASTGNSCAIGLGCKASGNNSIALGTISTLASGDYSTALGSISVASGDYSTSIGVGTMSTGLYATAMGRLTTAQATNSFVIGRFNVLKGSTTSWLTSDPLFVIGNGSSDSDRSNALEVTKDGDVGINVAPSSSYRLYVQDDNQAIRGIAVGTGTTAYGIFGRANAASSINYGIYGNAYGGTTNWSGYFVDDIYVGGSVTKASDEVKIDHPLDPENKYLSHSGVISDQMTTVYNGNAVMDIQGRAKIQLPDWFESLSSDFKYQLTAVGAPGPNLYISKKISGNAFEIAGGSEGMEVSWQVTGVRKDNYAKKNQAEIVTEKAPEDKGYYLHPESFGMPVERSISYKNEQESENRSEKSLK